MWKRGRIRSTVVSCVSLLAIVSALYWVNTALESDRLREGAVEGIGPLPDGRALRVLSLGFERVVADLFWIRTIHYMADEAHLSTGYPDADRLADLVTDIDPEFQTVYVLMGSGLTVFQGNPRGAVRLLEKGIQHVQYWKLHFLLGFTYFFELLEFGKAARQMAIASELPGAPPYLTQFSAKLYHQAGESETALAMIRARMAAEEHAPTRQALEKRYWDLWINRDLGIIDRAIGEYREVKGRMPADVEALVDAGLLERMPQDPQGGVYQIEDGRAYTELEYDVLEVHRGPDGAVVPQRTERER